MARQKKDGRSVNFYLDRNIMEKVEVYADENGHTLKGTANKDGSNSFCC